MKNKKALCIKDYYLDGKLEFKKGIQYLILKKHELGGCRGKGYLIKGDTFKGWFWEKITEYFDFSNLEKEEK